MPLGFLDYNIWFERLQTDIFDASVQPLCFMSIKRVVFILFGAATGMTVHI
jgi:hypothetical protein